MAAADQMPIGSGFHAKSTAREVVDGIDLTGRNAIVTGGYSGIGLETVRALAGAGARVTVPARRVDAAEAALANVPGEIEIAAMDLEDLSSVRKFTSDFEETGRALDILINNAGIMACPETRVGPGWERQLGVNHLAHMAMSLALAPALERADGARLVALSSTAHVRSDVIWDDPNYESHPYDKWEAYGASKTANALFATELNRRFSSEGITVNCVHPGVIMTDLSRSLTEDDFTSIATEGMKFKTVECGAATSVWAAVSPQLEGQGGYYLEDCHVGVELPASHMLAGYCDYALDNALAKKLWQKTEKLLAAI